MKALATQIIVCFLFGEIYAQEFQQSFFYVDVHLENQEVLTVLDKVHSELKANPGSHTTYAADPNIQYVTSELAMQLNWLDTASVVEATTHRISMKLDSNFTKMRIYSVAQNYNFQASTFWSPNIPWKDLPKYDAEEPIYTLMLSSMRNIIDPDEYELVLQTISEAVLNAICDRQEIDGTYSCSVYKGDEEAKPLFQYFGDQSYSRFVYREPYWNLNILSSPSQDANRLSQKELEDVHSYPDTTYAIDSGKEVIQSIYNDFVNLDFSLRPEILFEAAEDDFHTSEITIKFHNEYLGFRHRPGNKYRCKGGSILGAERRIVQGMGE